MGTVSVAASISHSVPSLYLIDRCARNLSTSRRQGKRPEGSEQQPPENYGCHRNHDLHGLFRHPAECQQRIVEQRAMKVHGKSNSCFFLGGDSWRAMFSFPANATNAYTFVYT